MMASDGLACPLELIDPETGSLLCDLGSLGEFGQRAAVRPDPLKDPGLTVSSRKRPRCVRAGRVRAVAAHIAMVPTAPGLLAMARGAGRAHGNFNRLNHDLAVRHARRPTANLVAELRDDADWHGGRWQRDGRTRSGARRHDDLRITENALSAVASDARLVLTCPIRSIRSREARVFAQIIKGKVSDPTAVRAVVDRWMQELGPAATGWLGSTGGVTEDGRSFELVRFESEQAAKANSDKPEQGEWWSEMEKLFEGVPTFQDSTDVEVEKMGDLDSAGFVQVILGKVSDYGRVKQLMATFPTPAESGRPEILGSVSVGLDGGQYAYVIYFTSESEARAGEAKEMPAEMKSAFAEMAALEVGEPEYLDLRTPWLDSPR